MKTIKTNCLMKLCSGSRLLPVFLWLLMLGSALPAQKAWAQSSSLQQALPPVPDPPRLVNDLGNMLDAADEQKLEQKLIDYEKSSSNEIAIVTIDRLGDFDIAEYANELGRKWNIGKASKKNGVLILASKEDRKINISPGYGLSGRLPDITCGRIIREQIVPNFKQGNFYAGFNEATDAIIRYAADEFTADPEEKGSALIVFLVLLFIIIVFASVVFGIFYAIRNNKGTYVSRKGWSDRNNDWGGPWGGFGGGSSWGGSSGGGSGGGFGGFGGGGGGFDGGGASGSW